MISTNIYANVRHDVLDICLVLLSPRSISLTLQCQIMLDFLLVLVLALEIMNHY